MKKKTLYCTDARGFEGALTANKKYEILGETENAYKIACDHGFEWEFSKSRFYESTSIFHRYLIA